MHKAVILNTCRIVRKFLADQCIRSAWSQSDPHSFENQLNCCEVRNVDDDNNDDDDDDDNNNNNNLSQKYIELLPLTPGFLECAAHYN
jgi:hypothetical protein